MLFWKDVGNRILLDRPLPFKLHQSYRPLPRFIREFNPTSQKIWSGPAGMQTSIPNIYSEHNFHNSSINTEPYLCREQRPQGSYYEQDGVAPSSRWCHLRIWGDRAAHLSYSDALHQVDNDSPWPVALIQKKNYYFQTGTTCLGIVLICILFFISHS